MKKVVFFLIISALFIVSCGKSEIITRHNSQAGTGGSDETLTDEDHDTAEEADDEEAPETDDADLPDDDTPDYSGTYGLPKCSLQGKAPCFDPMTDLAWSSLSDPMSHEDALIYCYKLDEGGFKDWYLPGIDELRTLIRQCPELEPDGECPVSEKEKCLNYDECLDEICYNTQCSAKKETIFSRIWDTDELWSSSKCLQETSYYGESFWTINFKIPKITHAYDESDERRLRCTRSVHSSGEDEGSETKTVKCKGLPENAQWNTVSSITQTWNGAKWLPDETGVFDNEPSTENCRFKCFDNFVWKVMTVDDEEYGKCVPECGKTDAEICSDTNGNIFFDKKTGLLWSSLAGKDDYVKDYSSAWKNAYNYCENLTEGEYSDWHLPTIDELRTLIKNCPATETGGTCNLDNIPDDLFDENNKVPDECLSCTKDEALSGKYSRIGDFVPLWSSTESPVRVNYVIKFYWFADFPSGRISTTNETANSSYYFVRCVRKEE